MGSKLTFSEEEIHAIFGHEAAEDEDPDRLRQYYFKSEVYSEVTANLPLRILVAHKGVGKSALFNIAIAECRDENRIAILIKPDDLLGIGESCENFLQRIRLWKEGLTGRIVSKVLTSAGNGDPTLIERAKKWSGRIIDFFVASIADGVVNLEPARRALVSGAAGQRGIDVFIDDLDRGWQGRREDVLQISALLNAARDMSQENRGLRFKISLRSDVYFLVRTSDESTDKIEGSVVWQSWTNHQILVLLIKRVLTFFGEAAEEDRLMPLKQSALAGFLDRIIESRFRGEAGWRNAPMHRVLMSLVRKRPRDIVKLLTLAGKEARRDSASLIRTEHLKAVFEEYSQGRLQDAINEFRSELPDIERLVTNMKPSRRSGRKDGKDHRDITQRRPFLYTTAELIDKIKGIGQFRRADGSVMWPKDLAAFLYKINFLTARKTDEQGFIVRRDFEEQRYLASEFVDFGFEWEVHPAYRWALLPERGPDIYQTIDLAMEE